MGKKSTIQFKYIRWPKVEEGEILKYEDIVITSQTDNLDENWNNIPYQNYNNKLYDRIEVLNITWASSLNIKLKYYGNKVNGSNDSDYLLIWTWKYSNYSNILNSWDAIKMYSWWDNYDYETFTITWDSITIWFKSYENTSWPWYWYHIIVEWYWYYENNINYNPTYPWYEFLWWYESWALEQFDFTWTEINQDRTLYAKWKANTYTVSFNADNDDTNPWNITVIYDSQYPELPVVTKTWYTFSWWYNWEEMVSSWNIVKITEDVILKAKRKMNQYKIIFDTDGWNEINSVEKDYNSVINITLPTPTKECNEFSWWDTELPERMPAHDITLKAIWEYTCSRSSWGGWWAKKSESTTREIAIDTSTDQEHNSADEGQKTETNETSNTPTNWETSNQVISVTQEISEDWTPIEVVVQTVTIKNTDIVATVRTEIPSSNTTRSSSSSKTHTKEENDAYSFAKSNGITTTDSIDNAKMNTELTRIQMAKMLSNYAINVLWQEPDVSKWTIKFDDVTNKMDKQYDNAVTKAYQLGIMWQNVKNNEFRPNDEVTRGEFASALSRLLYQTEEWNYKWTWKYYVPHVARLYNEWIINKTDPKIKEKRWYVMTMLMRTVQ